MISLHETYCHHPLAHLVRTDGIAFLIPGVSRRWISLSVRKPGGSKPFRRTLDFTSAGDRDVYSLGPHLSIPLFSTNPASIHHRDGHWGIFRFILSFPNSRSVPRTTDARIDLYITFTHPVPPLFSSQKLVSGEGVRKIC